jgi:hypothetical protein
VRGGVPADWFRVAVLVGWSVVALASVTPEGIQYFEPIVLSTFLVGFLVTLCDLLGTHAGHPPVRQGWIRPALIATVVCACLATVAASVPSMREGERELAISTTVAPALLLVIAGLAIAAIRWPSPRRLASLAVVAFSGWLVLVNLPQQHYRSSALAEVTAPWTLVAYSQAAAAIALLAIFIGRAAYRSSSQCSSVPPRAIVRVTRSAR